jgi:hypothetical protein
MSERTNGYNSSVAVTRPANATPYGTNDVVGATSAVITFPNVAPHGKGSIRIVGADLLIAATAVPSGMTAFTIHLYSSTPATSLADNAIFTVGATDRASYLGAISIGTAAVVGTSTVYVENTSLNKQVPTSGTDLYGYLVTTGAFTSAATSEVYTVGIHAVAV